MLNERLPGESYVFLVHCFAGIFSGRSALALCLHLFLRQMFIPPNMEPSPPPNTRLPTTVLSPVAPLPWYPPNQSEKDRGSEYLQKRPTPLGRLLFQGNFALKLLRRLADALPDLGGVLLSLCCSCRSSQGAILFPHKIFYKAHAGLKPSLSQKQGK